MTAIRTVISPSILSCDFANAGAECRDVLAKGADWLHCDVMDGHFVPNITIGIPVIASLRKALGPAAFLDCHLMISHPAKYVADFAKAGANMYTFHIECFPDHAASDAGYQQLAAICQDVRAKGMKCGIAISPGTPLDEGLAATLHRLIDGDKLVDMVLVMTVRPGFGGQSFMGDMMPKVAALRGKYPALDIQVDGGIDAKTAPIVHKAGANVLVAGTAIFTAPDRAAMIETLRHSSKL